jgi:hypothetical protein
VTPRDQLRVTIDLYIFSLELIHFRGDLGKRAITCDEPKRSALLAHVSISQQSFSWEIEHIDKLVPRGFSWNKLLNFRQARLERHELSQMQA